MHTRTRHASATQTQTEPTANKKTLVLKLKENEADKPSIKWTEDTVDNEGMGRKSSKRKTCLPVGIFRCGADLWIEPYRTVPSSSFRLLYLS